MRRQALLIDPSINRVTSHPEVSHDLLNGEPSLTGRSRLIPCQILHEAVIISNTRKPWGSDALAGDCAIVPEERSNVWLVGSGESESSGKGLWCVE
jgi:hypothetical protein